MFSDSFIFSLDTHIICDLDDLNMSLNGLEHVSRMMSHYIVLLKKNHNKRVFENNTTLAWVYHVTEVTPDTMQAVEFQKVTPTSLIKATNSQVITLSPEGYHPFRILSQERHGAPFIVARELPSLTKPPLFWIFESSFINGLPWDQGEWHWQASSQMGDSPFFGYFAKRGCRNARKPTQSMNICSFIQRLNLQNFTVTQVMANIWHNSRPQKVGTLIWFTLNRGLPVGT
jgi:hypothetical protein